MSGTGEQLQVLTAEQARELREHGRAHCVCGEWVTIRDRAAMDEHKTHTEPQP